MLSCLKEIASVYLVPPDEVAKVRFAYNMFPRLCLLPQNLQYVVENLRHLDNAIVLNLVKARSDYSPTLAMTLSGATTWTKQLEDIYSAFRGEILLPWENRKHITIMAFTESSHAGPSTIGPSTLRKSPTINSSIQNKGPRDANLNSPYVSFPFRK